MGKNRKKINIKYTCLGGARQVTGSCHLLTVYVESKEYNIIVDYGMVQDGTRKLNELYSLNKKDKPIDWNKIDNVILTHSHADHSSLLPISVMSGYQGDIIATAPTIKLTNLILSDSAFIQNRETERFNKTKEGKKNPLYPIYSQIHVEQTMGRFRGYDYNKEIVLNEHVTLTLKPTGHLLGACSPLVEVRCGDEVERVLFTGDTSASKAIPFTKKSNFKELKVDHIISEGTYGNKLQKKNNAKQKLKKHISETCLQNNGQLVIPVFAVGRSSSVIKYLYDVYQDNPTFNDIPIYLCSPMAVKSHKIYGDSDSFNFYNRDCHKYKDVFKWDKVECIEDYKTLESVVLNTKPKIVLCSSGMVVGGYSVAVSSGMLPHQNSTILFVGYQGLGTIGRNIMSSEYGDVIRIDSKNVKRKCNIDFINLSSHADYRMIISMFKTMRHTKIKNIILAHGDENALINFKDELDKEFNARIEIAEYNKVVKL